jgi:hypothetical protein
MNSRRTYLLLFGLLLAALLLPRSFGQMPPAEQLLPDDVIGFATVPDWKKLAAAYEQSAWGQLLADSAMKPFRDSFSSNLQADFIKPLEKQLGIKLGDYDQLLQGQITIALTPPKEGAKQFSTILFLLDVKDKSELLSSKLSELKKKWSEGGKGVKTEKIRDVEFAIVSLSGADVDSVLKKAFPSADEEKEKEKDKDKDKEDSKEPAEKTQLRIGQYKSLLIIGENEKVIEKLLARQAGGLVPPLAEKASYQKTHALMFRDSVAHAWVNIKPIYQKILQFAAAEPQEAQPGMALPKVDKILPALGFSSIETLAAKIGASPDGSSFEAMLGVPEAQREGLFKILTIEKKDASPPAFVPADVVKFQRTRLDAQKAWNTVESMLQRIDPSLAGLVQLMLSSAGKDKDPNFDLKKNLFGNLGDDFIQYQKNPSGRKVLEPDSPPSLLLIGSPNPPQLLDAIRALSALLPTGGGAIKEREFLGKKIYSLNMASSPADLPGGQGPGGKPSPDDEATAGSGKKLNFTTSAGYVAFSADDGILEDYLRSGENPPKPLRALPGLTEAAQKAGGMENGLFSYQNQAEDLHATMDILKNDPEGFNRMLFFSLSHGDEEGQGIFKHLFDLKLLPGFDRISKYFGIAVVSGATTADGFVVKAFAPRPPGLSK